MIYVKKRTCWRYGYCHLCDFEFGWRYGYFVDGDLEFGNGEGINEYISGLICPRCNSGNRVHVLDLIEQGFIWIVEEEK
jgi:hypothetical protein